jgi:Kef-type K+ transport system membrane component KefB
MSLTTVEIAKLLLALGLLLVAAHTMGYLFARFRQPPVIGEILGGLMMGPTVFGLLFPAAQGSVFPTEGATATVLGAVYQLGLFFLMFAAGSELRSVFHRGERKTASLITLTGTVLPFAIGLGVLAFVDLSSLMGSAQNETAFVLVFAIAIAVTSIPVISRIMLDLGIIKSPFARIVLSAAVLEDVALYVVLAVALGLVQQASGDDFGLTALLNLDPASTLSMTYHVFSTLAFFGICLWLGPKLLGPAMRSRFNVLHNHNPISFQLTVVLALTLIALLLGITPMFGAFIAGLVVGMTAETEEDEKARESLKNFAMAFFIPIYFAIVGVKLDLIHDFNPMFFAVFLAFACLVKWTSVYMGARLSGQTREGATNLAVAMNARGGPGIVLASVAFDAGIINAEFYVTLVLLAIVTSLAAGTFLERVIKSGRPLLGREPVKPRFETAPGAVPGIALSRSEGQGA